MGEMEGKMVLAEGFALSIVSGIFGIWGGVSGLGYIALKYMVQRFYERRQKDLSLTLFGNS